MDLTTLRQQRPELANLDDATVVKTIASEYGVPEDRVAKDLGVPIAPPPAPKRTFLGTAADLGISALQGAISVPQSAVGIADLVTGGRAGQAVEGLGVRFKDANEFLSDQLSDAQKHANLNVQNADGFVDTAKAAITNPSTIVHSVIQSLPSMAAGGLVGRGILAVGARAMGAEAAAAGSMGPYAVPGTLARAVGSETGAEIAGALGEGVTMAGQDTEQFRADNPDGLLKNDQASIGVGIGAEGAAFALVGAKVAHLLGLNNVHTMIAAGRANPVAAKGLTRRLLEGAVAEGLLEEMPQSIGEQVLQNMATDKPLDEGVDNQAVMGFFAGAAMGAGANVMGHDFSKHPKAPGQPAADAPAPVGPLSAAVTAVPATGNPTPEASPEHLNEAVAKLVEDESGNRTPPPGVEHPVPPAGQQMVSDRDADIYREVTGGVADPFADVPAAKPTITPGTVDEGAHAAATSPTNDRPEPTAAQAEAGNYKVGRVKVGGLDLSIENPAGSTREDKANTPPKWSTTMHDHYGYILKTEAADGDHVDAYVRNGTPTDYEGPVYVVDQVNQHDHSYDEAKVMLGYNNRAAAVNAYKSHYSPGWVMGRMTEMPMAQFKEWVKTADTKKPASPKGPLPLKGAPNVTENQTTPAAPSGQSPAGGHVQDAASGGAVRGGMEGTDAAAGAPGAAAGGAAAKNDAQPAGERVGEPNAPAAQPEKTAPVEPPAAGTRAAEPATGAAASPVQAAGAEPVVEHITGKGKTLTGYVRAIDPQQARQIDSGTFKKNGGWFLRKDRADAYDAAHPEAKPAAAPEQVYKGYSAASEALKAAGDGHEIVRVPKGLVVRPKAGNKSASAAEFPAAPNNTTAAATTPAVESGQEAKPGAGNPETSEGNQRPVAQFGRAMKDSGLKPDGLNVRSWTADLGGGHEVHALLSKDDSVVHVTRFDHGEVAEEHAVVYGAEATRTVAEQVKLAMRAPAKPATTAKSGADLLAADLAGYKAGGKAFADGATRVPPSGAEARYKKGWLRGWDQANIAAPLPESKVSANTVFTEDAAAKARAILKSKLGTPMSNIDPELLQAGITLAGYHIEKGARTFAAYAQAMVGDLGEGIRPYLKSFYMAVKYDPRATAFDGMDEAATVEKADHQTAGMKAAPSLVDHFAGEIADGRMPKDNPALKKMVEAFDGKPADQARMKQAQEALEAGIVTNAEGIAKGNGTDREKFDELRKLYDSQPLLNVRTSTSIENQAYSTPAPLAFLASRLAGIDSKTKVLEPTAGTGMLLMQANPQRAVVNELNPERAAILDEHGYMVTQQDATTADWPKVDAVITNPPFGSLHDDEGKTKKVPVDGFKIGQIDHLIAARALEAMKDDGRAVLILGANKVAGGLSADDRIFFNWLYSHYNVSGHFEVDGKLYTRQGAGWPVRVISIEGRQASDAHAPAEGTIQRVYDWEQVYGQYENALASRGEPGTAPAASTRGGSAEAEGATRVPGQTGDATARPGGRGSRSSTADDGNVAGAGSRAVVDRPAAGPDELGGGDSNERHDAAAPAPDRLEPAGQREAGSADKPAGGAGAAALSDADNAFQTKYVPASSRKDEGVLIPVNMAQPLQDALAKLEDEVGDIDKFAAKELGYKSTKELHDALMGLQVDSVASAIHQLKQGKGLIIADQTGIGKGRQAAAMIRWAILNGKTPVFFTVKPELFTDMLVEDLRGIGSGDTVKPFVMNVNEPIVDHDGSTLFVTTPQVRRMAIDSMRSGQVPKGHNAVFVTYSQINVENDQRGALMGIAPNSVFILDESHNAGGESATGEFVRGLLDQGTGVVYLSATFAKRPDNMPLYFKTDMGEAVADNDTLMDAMTNGGLPLQTVVSNNLVKAGQMFRRERSFDGINILSRVDTKNRAEHEKLADATTQALRAIVAADKAFTNNHFADIEDAAKADAKEAKKAGNQPERSVDHTEFSSVVHNFVRQMLLGLNANEAAESAITAIKAGKKPVIAVENTMGSFLMEYAARQGLQPGQPLGDYGYRTVLSRALDRTRYYIEKDRQGNKTKIYVPLEELDPVTRRAYDDAQAVIDGLNVDIPASPIDWMRHRLSTAGYSVAEITGRAAAVDYTDPKRPKLAEVPKDEQDDKTLTTRRFNGLAGQPLDAIILNVSGSTGISLHASEKFKDQKPRKMIVAQAAQDINILMQMLGRIHRTGQVVLPEYEFLNPDLPAVIRPMALTSKKMKSLNANTSSNTESATSVQAVDMLNKYGDEVVGQYLNDNPQLRDAMGLTNKIASDGTPEPDLARMATGRLALQPVAVQHQFYEEVESQYKTYIDYLNKTNQNELEPRTFDFDAKELKSETIFEGTNPKSPFGEDASYGEYSIKAQGKPMTPAEIREAMAEHLDGKQPSAHVAEITKGLEAGFATYRGTLTDEQKPLADGVRARAQEFLTGHPIGSMFNLDINGDEYRAVVTNIRTTHKPGRHGNPYSLSKINVTVALNGGLRSVTVPATKMEAIELSRMPQVASLDHMFKVKPDDREVAKIITGNLLGAYGELKGTRGTIISFTKQDGTSDLGILLPKAFTIAENAKGGFRLRSGEDAVRFLHESGLRDVEKLGIATRDGEVRITPGDNGGITIRVPLSKARGAKYFLDKTIRAATGDFASQGGRMVAHVDAVNAAAAIDAINRKSAVYVLPSMTERARQMFGDKPPAMNQSEFKQDASIAGPATPAKMVRLQQLADTVTEKWAKAPEVIVVASVAHQDTPTAVRAEARQVIMQGGNTPSAVLYGGKAYLFADRIHSDEQAVEAIAHEIKGHFGLRGNFGPDLDGILKQIAQARPAQVAQMIRKNGFKADERLRAAEEILAEMAQKQPELGFVRRAVAAIRTFLRGLGLNLKLTDDEIVRNWLAPAAQFVERGGRSATKNLAPGANFSSGASPFYSALSRGLEAMPDKSLTHTGWEGAINALVNKGKAKADEVEWSGVKDWLAMQEGRVPKEAVVQYLAENGVHVQEVQKASALDDSLSKLREQRDSVNVRLTAIGFEMRDEYGEPILHKRINGMDYTWEDGQFVDEDGEPLQATDKEARDLAMEYGRLTDEIENYNDGYASNDPTRTKYGQYTLPGGENYREVLLTLPEKDKITTERAPAPAGWGDTNGGNVGVVRHGDTGADYRSSHWSEPNILAHIRLNDRTDADGKRVLFVEELQSDWVQAGRKRGIQGEAPAPVEKLPEGWSWKKIGGQIDLHGPGGFEGARTAQSYDTNADLDRKAVELYNDIAKRKVVGDKVPNAPFIGKTDAWLALSLKRIIKMAVDEGYDKVAFVNGAQSAERYSLEKHISSVSWASSRDDIYGGPLREVQIKQPGGQALSMYVTSRGIVTAGWSTALMGEPLSSVIGEELAAKIMEKVEGSLSGVDLKIGGEGMKSFYDKIVPAAANKLLAKFGGGKVEPVQVVGHADYKTLLHAGEATGITQAELDRMPFAERKALVDSRLPAQSGFTITPSMRESAKDGLPLFAQNQRTIQVDGVRRPDTNASGQPIVPASQGMGALKNFWHWFGDSKVADAQGRPVVAYHGTVSDFSTFKPAPFFTTQADAANFYAEDFHGDMSFEDNPDGLTAGAQVLPVYLSIKNPLDVRERAGAMKFIALAKRAGVDIKVTEHPGGSWDFETDEIGKHSNYDGQNLNDLIYSPRVRAQMQAEGFDGLHAWDVLHNQEIPLYIPLAPEQIKSALGNNGMFDARSPDIMFSQYQGTNDPRQFLQVGLDVVHEFADTPGKLNWWHKSMGTMNNLAERSAPFKKVFDGLQTYIADISHYATEAADLAPRILPKLDKWRDMLPAAMGGKAPLAVEDKKAIQAPIWEGQVLYTRDQDGRPITVSQAEARYEGMDEHDKSQMLLSRGHITEGELKRWRNLPIASYEGAVNNRFEREYLKPGIRWKDEELKSLYGLTPDQISLHQEARDSVDLSVKKLALSDMLKLGGADTRAIADMVMESTDLGEASDTIRQYLTSLATEDPERSAALMDAAGKIHDKAMAAQRLLDKGYAPLMRFGHYTVDVVDQDGERVYFGLYEGRMAARAAAEQMRDLFPGATVTRGTTSEEAYKAFAGTSIETMELFGEMLGLEESGSGAANEAFNKWLKLTKSNRSALRRLIERKGIAGYNEDITRVLAGFVTSNARQVSANLHTKDIAEATMEIPKGQGELQDTAHRLTTYVFNPQNDAPAVKNLLFAQYLGGSIASALVNMTQPVQVTMPYLSQYGGIRAAARAMRQGLTQGWQGHTGDVALDAALKRAEEDGVVAPQEIHQLMAYGRGAGSLKAGDGTLKGNAAAMGSNFTSRVQHGWGQFFASAELFNRRVTYVAAWRLATEQGIKNPDAFARKAVEQTQFIYTKANRPQWARGALGGTLFTFKQYGVSYIELLHRMWTQGGPEGKKAALFGLAMIVMMAGAGGLPFMEDATDILEGIGQRFGYNLSLKTERKKLLQAVFGDVLGGFLESGVSAALPLDVSGRMGMQNLIPGTGLFKMKADHTSDVLELAGPAGDLGKRAFQAVGQVAQGKPLEAMSTMSPQATRNLDKARDMLQTGMYRDQNGKRVIDTDAWDAFIKAVGFQPADVATVQDSMRTIQDRVSVARLEQQEIAAEWAKRVFEKDPNATQWAQEQVRAWNEKNEDSPIRVRYQDVLKRVREMNKTKAERLIASTPTGMRAEVRKQLAGPQ